MANKLKGKRRMKRTMKVLKRNKRDNDWIRLCTKLGWFD